jgi:hypothetical protein
MDDLIEEMRGKHRMRLVEMQILSDNCEKVVCPFCKEENLKAERRFCCDLLRKAVVAVLAGQRALKTAAAAEKAMQN